MKNKYIELERFIASCMILLLHLFVSKGSWIFVEFFYLLTGYFTVSHLERKKDLVKDNTWYPIQYTWNKFIKLFPYTTLSLLWLWLLNLVKCDFKGFEIIKWLLCLPTELMLISGSGMVPTNLEIAEGIYSPLLLNPQLWYICCMLFVFPLVVFLFMFLKKSKPIVVTILPMFLYGILVMKSGTITGWHDPKFSLLFCSIRALAGLLLGAFVYYVSQWWKNKNYTYFGTILLTILEIGCFGIVLVVSHFTDMSYDALFIFLLFLSVSLSTSGVTYTARISMKSVDFLGEISLPIYCLQLPIIDTCNACGITNTWAKFVITIMISIFVVLMFRLVERTWSIISRKLKSLIIL